MKRKELICIGCPMGCPIVVEMEDGRVLCKERGNESNSYCNYYSPG